MNNPTHTSPPIAVGAIGMTRILDVARDVLLRMGEWQYHPALIVSADVQYCGSPTIYLTLSDHAKSSEYSEFAGAVERATGVTARSGPGGRVLSVLARDWERTGVTVIAQVPAPSEVER